jgi:hypothetical protein
MRLRILAVLMGTMIGSAGHVAAQGGFDDGTVSIQLSTRALKFVPTDIPKEEDVADRIIYQPVERNGTMVYEPVWEPWRIYTGGGPITGGDFYEMMFREADPAYVELHIVNEGAAPIAITGAEVVVSESLPDLKPIIAIAEEDQTMQIDVATLRNYGWGPVENAVAHFRLLRPDADPVYGDYEYSADIGTFPFESNIDLKPVMQALGMDPQALLEAADKTEYQYDPANIEFALGQLATISERDEEGIVKSAVLVVGEIDFGWTDARGASHAEKIRFHFRHTFFDRYAPEMGAPAPISGTFNVELPLSGSNYVKRFPYQRVVEAGATDRITVGIRSARSAFHAFRLRFFLSDGRELLSPPSQLHFLVPGPGHEPDAEYQ